MKLEMQAAVMVLGVGLAVSTVSRAAKTSTGTAPPARAQIVRQIDDPGTGRRWLLERDPAHPGGPGRLVDISGRAIEPAMNAGAQAAVPSPFRPVIRAGDRLVLSQETAVVSARFEAVALEPAAIGKEFKVRLKYGGKVMVAVALAPGLAKVAEEIGAWR